MQQLGASDAAFIYKERAHATQQICLISVYDGSTLSGGKSAFDSLKVNLEGRLHLARAFRQKVVRVPMDLDLPYWVEDPEFDLEFHIHKVSLENGADWPQFWAEAATICAMPLDQSRPLWALDVIEGLDGLDEIPPGSFATILRVHHAAVDGVAGMELFTALHDRGPDVTIVDSGNPWKPEPDPSSKAMLGRAAIGLARNAVPLGTRLIKAAPKVREAARDSGWKSLAPSRVAPATSFNAPISPHRVIVTRRFPLAELKRLKSAVAQATINDVALAIVGGALREYLLAAGSLPDLPMVALAPVSVRTEGLADAGGNEISGMFIPLATDVADPLDRLCTIRDATKQQKQIAGAIGARTLTEISAALPGALIGLGIRGTGNTTAGGGKQILNNTIISNIPGPQQSLYTCGARMITLDVTGPLEDGMGIFHLINSYDGVITLTVFACREMLPDHDFYGACIDTSYAALFAAISL